MGFAQIIRINLVTLLLTSMTYLSAHADTLRVGLSELDYPPYYYAEDDSLVGAAIEIAEATASISGHELHYVRVPWKRLQNMLKTGSLDMVILYFKTPERAQDVIYSAQPHIYENSYAIVPKHLHTSFDGTIESLSRYDLFFVRGYSHGEAFDHSDNLAKHAVNNEIELLKRVASGRPFIGVGNKPALIRQAEKLGLQDQIAFLSPPFDYGENYFAFSKMRDDAQQLADAFSKAFEHYGQSEAYHKTLKKYGFED